MLKEIIRGSEKSKIVLIEDCMAQSGVPLLRAFLSSLASRVKKVHLVLYELEPSVLINELSTPVKVHNVSQDPLGWHGNKSITMDTDLHKYFKQHLPPSGSNENCAVIFDCIGALMLHKSASYVCQILQRLTRDTEVEQIVCLAHTELHTSTCSFSFLHHTCNTVVALSSPQQPTFHGVGSLTHRRLSGKITKIKEQYTLSKDFQILESEEVKSVIEMITDESNQADPTANLTFNLSLSEKEKSARSQVVLPYVHDKQKQEATLMKSAGESKIFYQPDEADDFDEEDPDDDLDI